jgi:hypothetical protein
MADQRDQQVVEAALREHEPSLTVVALRVEATADGPRIQGRVASETDREWVIGVARNALGVEVHDGLEVDAALPPSVKSTTTVDAGHDHLGPEEAAPPLRRPDGPREEPPRTY